MPPHHFEITNASNEEDYFLKHNQALIERKRKELEARQAAEAAQAKHDHWMKCPKCGADIEEIELMGIIVDQCGKCHGVFFDKGEVDILLESQGSVGFLQGLSRLFK